MLGAHDVGDDDGPLFIYDVWGELGDERVEGAGRSGEGGTGLYISHPQMTVRGRRLAR